MLPDLLSVALRGLSFIAMAQAGGAAIYLALFGARLGPSRARVVSMARVAATIALLALPAQLALEAARMTGSLAGIADLELQRFALSSRGAVAWAVRMGGLVLLLLCLAGATRVRQVLGLAGVTAMVLSFALTGHTVSSPLRWALAPLLVAHVAIVMFWFGSLQPLRHAASAEPAGLAAHLAARFSRLAAIAVPLILVAGIAMAAALLAGLQGLARPYGTMLLVKLAAFGLLMLIAAVNRWRLAPALASGGPGAKERFRLSLQVEWLVIAAVLIATAAMTTFLSPR